MTEVERLARLLGCSTDPEAIYQHVRDAVQCLAAARADVASADRRLAARLRAKADEVQAAADPNGRARSHHDDDRWERANVIADALRAEADALVTFADAP